MLLLTTEKARAVYFFDQAEIAGQLLLPEFESMLDGFVPSKEWALRTMQAVYVEINHRLLITSAVFFKVGFDDHGWIDGSWNMPLAELAKRAQPGPDLGAGPIHMATFTQCPQELYKHLLWDPEVKGRQNHLGQLKKAVSRNRLGICFVSDAQDDPSKPDNLVAAMGERLQTVLNQHLNERDDSGIKNVLAKVIDEQARIPTLVPSTEDLKERVEIIEQTLQERDEQLANLEAQLEQLNQQLVQANEQNAALINKADGLRNYYEHKLIRFEQQQLSLVAQTQLSAVSNTEIASAVHEATQDFAELLQRKEIELLYRSEREEQLLNQLRDQNEHPVAHEGIIEYLQLLADHGIRFVHYRAGLTPIQIPMGELADFLASPCAYTAQKLGVSEQHYNAWLKHFLMPVCTANTPEGTCSANIYRVEEPGHFLVGVSDHCAEHQAHP
ncbi:MAG: hypothetical protein RL497_221 [Pseudomonadota bacterium]|jgi:hypothetical protein